MIRSIFTCVTMVLFGFSGSLSGQSDYAFYNDAMSNSHEPAHRLKAAALFDSLFFKALTSPDSFSDPYEELKWVSIKKSGDDSFRIITWQVKGENEVFQYFGYIQMNDGTLFPLKDRSASMSDAEFEEHNQDYWFGAVYYNMIERKVENDTRYFLFGYNGLGPDVQLKLIDELHFVDGKPVFGNESFVEADGNERPTIKNRVIIDYSETAYINCNFNEGMNLIVHDFVTPRLGVSPSGIPVKIPDGTYVGYEWKGDKWHRIERIKNQISTPESIYYQPKEKDDKDIFGRPRNR